MYNKKIELMDYYHYLASLGYPPYPFPYPMPHHSLKQPFRSPPHQKRQPALKQQPQTPQHLSTSKSDQPNSYQSFPKEVQGQQQEKNKNIQKLNQAKIEKQIENRVYYPLDRNIRQQNMKYEEVGQHLQNYYGNQLNVQQNNNQNPRQYYKNAQYYRDTYSGFLDQDFRYHLQYYDTNRFCDPAFYEYINMNMYRYEHNIGMAHQEKNSCKKVKISKNQVTQKLQQSRQKSKIKMTKTAKNNYQCIEKDKQYEELYQHQEEKDQILDNDDQHQNDEGHEKQHQQDLSYAKKNTQSNIINQIFSFVSLENKSRGFVKKIVKEDKKVKSFYQILKYIKKFKKKYVNRKYLSHLCILKEDNVGYKMILRGCNKMKVLTVEQFQKVLMTLITYYLKSQSQINIITSRKINKLTFSEHLVRRRQIRNYLMKYFEGEIDDTYIEQEEQDNP